MPQRTSKMLHTEVAVEATKATPPAAVATLDAAMRGEVGVVGWATLIYIGLQAAYLLWKWWHEHKSKANETRCDK
jgi:hypothetical protein